MYVCSWRCPNVEAPRTRVFPRRFWPIVSIFTYGMQKGIDRLSAANVVNTSLCDLDTLVKVAVEENYIKPEDEAKLLKFRDNPSDESWMTHQA